MMMIDDPSIEMMTDYYPDKLIGRVTMEASHWDLLRIYQTVPAQSNIQTVIVTMNLQGSLRRQLDLF